MTDNVVPFRRKDDGDEQPGSINSVVEDLEVAHGHVVEAKAEAEACEGPPIELVDALLVADAAVTKALQHAHREKRR